KEGGMAAEGEEVEGGGGPEEVVVDTGRIRIGGRRVEISIPERIVKKLARMAGLEYRDGAREGGGGLCKGIEGNKPRGKALMLLGAIVEKIGKGSTDAAIEECGASWLDVMVWREDPEYAALWREAERLRDTVAAARVKDGVIGGALDGQDVEEAKNVGGELQRITIHKYDNFMALQLLKGMGVLGKDVMKPGKVMKGAPAPKPVPGVDGAPAVEEMPGASVDTVLFADRATAFRAMGQAVDKAEEVKGG
ncbi:MAG TPA: hypothetical protein PK535_11505, partial [Synergistaceae bacterium]|nr:hypothetical protein [Synergistaceae bacterium]